MAPASKLSLRSSVQTFPLHCSGVVTNPGQGRTLHNKIHTSSLGCPLPASQSAWPKDRGMQSEVKRLAGTTIGSLQSPAPPAAEEGRDGRP